MKKFKKIRNSLWRLTHSYEWKFYWWTWNCIPGFFEEYYDGWNCGLNLGFFSICWMSFPRKGDEICENMK